MLMIEERKQAIQILVEVEMGKFYDPTQGARELLATGHKGYNRFTDAELIRALHMVSKSTMNNSHRAREFVGNLMIDRIVLGD